MDIKDLIDKEKLEKWKKNTLPVANTRRITGDYLDDIKDYERKEAWSSFRDSQNYRTIR